MSELTPDSALAQVARAVMTCTRCPRLRSYCASVAREKRAAFRHEHYWGRPVPGFGDPSARLLVVGLAPGAHGANRTGRLFTGDSSGEFLMRSLHRAGFASLPTSHSRDDGLVLSGAYISAAVRCAPPANKPAPEEIERCLSFLAAELRALDRLAVIVALGRIAFDAVLRVLADRGVCLRPRPQFTHGQHLVPGHGLPVVIASYHPSRQNTNTGRLTESMFDQIFHAARRLTVAEPEG